MPKPIDDFMEYIVGDVLGHVPHITSKRMFGGYGLYQAGHIFAIITSDETVYFKADTDLAPTYEAAGATQFIYTGHTDKVTPMPYWQVPEAVLEDRELIADWVTQSAAVTAA